MRAAISSPGFPSDTYELVDACIAQVRSAAHLDDESVLPPLPKLAPRRAAFIASPAGHRPAVHQVTSAARGHATAAAHATRAWVSSIL